MTTSICSIDGRLAYTTNGYEGKAGDLIALDGAKAKLPKGVLGGFPAGDNQWLCLIILAPRKPRARLESPFLTIKYRTIRLSPAEPCPLVDKIRLSSLEVHNIVIEALATHQLTTIAQVRPMSSQIVRELIETKAQHAQEVNRAYSFLAQTLGASKLVLG